MKIILLTLLLGACSTVSDTKREHREWLKKVELQRQTHDKSTYLSFLKREIKLKQDERINLLARQERMDNIQGQREVHESPVGNNVHGLQSFQDRTGKMSLKRGSEQVKMVDKQIFFLRSQISALESLNIRQ